MLFFYKSLKLNTEIQRGEVFDQLMIDRLRFFISKQKERNENNVKTFYVWYITRRNRKTDDGGTKFFTKENRHSN